MDKLIVSFCIAAFRRYNELNELIQEILSVKSEKIEVIVCDNMSSDGSVEELEKISDDRLKIHVNEKNFGSLLNIHEALDKGRGKYLFYVNDRDNVDNFKIERLIEILECLDKENVAFAKCVPHQNGVEKYRIFEKGKESLIQFSCAIDHPTGYIFKREIWHKIRNRRLFFEKQKYGDYAVTLICAIMARQYSGALIYGDICDLDRQRIDFTMVKSRYYENRKDKRLWYTPEVIYRELRIGQEFLKKLKVQEDIRNEILIARYTAYLSWCVTNYKNIIADPVCTTHYDLYPSQNFIPVFLKSMVNGFKLWSKTNLWLLSENRKLCGILNRVTKEEYTKYFRELGVR